jgi:hypothetical protein
MTTVILSSQMIPQARPLPCPQTFPAAAFCQSRKAAPTPADFECRAAWRDVVCPDGGFVFWKGNVSRQTRRAVRPKCRLPEVACRAVRLPARSSARQAACQKRPPPGGAFVLKSLDNAPFLKTMARGDPSAGGREVSTLCGDAATLGGDDPSLCGDAATLPGDVSTSFVH